MKYLMIYRGYPRKSLTDVSAQQINKMPEEERAKYIQVPMTGTLEEVVRNYIAENEMSKRDSRILAKGLGVEPEKVLRPNMSGKWNMRHEGGGVPIAAQVSRETKNALLKMIEEKKYQSLSEAVDELLQIALGTIQK